MTPCPTEALPVVEILRRDVPRPTELPRPDEFTGKLRWDRPEFFHGCCPLGLHPKIDYSDPWAADVEYCLDGKITERQAWNFIHWWDGLTAYDSTEAVDFIWPTKGA